MQWKADVSSLGNWGAATKECNLDLWATCWDIRESILQSEVSQKSATSFDCVPKWTSGPPALVSLAGQMKLKTTLLF